MKTTSYVLAALAMFILAPASIAPATAQVSIGVDREGPQVRIGHDDRGRYRDDDRRRHEGWRNQADCREVTVRRRGPDGSMTTRTTRRCD